MYSLFPVDSSKGKNDLLIKKKRVLVGRVQACDIVIPYSDITAIHAVIEVGDNGFIVYDMNSRNGTFVNGEKIIKKSFGLNDKLKFSVHEFVIKEIQSADILPPPLDIIPINESSSTKYQKPSLPQELPRKENEIVPRVDYPLAKDPKAEFSEYIFEDVNDLYPIFNYQVNRDAVEVIILFKDKIFSVDYLPFKKNVTYYLVGNVSSSSHDVEYSYLGHNQRVPFVNVMGDEIFVENLPGYKLLSLSETKGVNKEASSSSLCLTRDNILSFNKKDLSVFVRRTDAPPLVRRAPILRRDGEFKKYLFLVFLLMAALLGGMNYLQVDKEIEKEKAPERIATILYKKKIVVSKNKAVFKTEKKPKKVVQKSPNAKPMPKPVKKKVTKVVKPKKVKPKLAKAKKSVVKKPVPIKKPSKVKKRVVKKPSPVKVSKPKKNNRPKVARVRKQPVSQKKSPRAKPGRGSRRKSNVVAKSKGAVDTYKSFDFKSTVSSLMAKGGAVKNVNVAKSADVTKGLSGVSGAGSKGATVKRSKLSGNVGSLAGAAAGKLDTDRDWREFPISRSPHYSRNSL